MKTWKKVGALVAAAGLTFSLAACGGDDKKADDTKETTTSSTNEGTTDGGATDDGTTDDGMTDDGTTDGGDDGGNAQGAPANVDDLYERVSEAGKSLKSAKMTMESTTVMPGAPAPISTSMDIEIMTDPLTFHGTVASASGNTEMWAVEEGDSYVTYASIGGAWQKKTVSGDEITEFTGVDPSSLGSISKEDLDKLKNAKVTEEGNTYVLTGDLDSSFLTTDQDLTATSDVSGTIKVAYDKDTYYPVSQEMEMKMTMDAGTGPMEVTLTMDATVSDHNAVPAIVVPDEVKNSAN